MHASRSAGTVRAARPSPSLRRSESSAAHRTQSSKSGTAELRNPAAPISVGRAHSHAVTEAHWSPDGKQAVSVGTDSCICVWNFFG